VPPFSPWGPVLFSIARQPYPHAPRAYARMWCAYAKCNVLMYIRTRMCVYTQLSTIWFNGIIRDEFPFQVGQNPTRVSAHRATFLSTLERKKREREREGGGGEPSRFIDRNYRVRLFGKFGMSGMKCATCTNVKDSRTSDLFHLDSV